MSVRTMRGGVMSDPRTSADAQKSADVQRAGVRGAEAQEKAIQDKAILTFPDGTRAELPLTAARAGAGSIDVSTLIRQTGYTALDYGFVNTASTRSAITFIDGNAGILRYRGYPIEQLAEHSTYLE